MNSIMWSFLLLLPIFAFANCGSLFSRENPSFDVGGKSNFEFLKQEILSNYSHIIDPNYIMMGGDVDLSPLAISLSDEEKAKLFELLLAHPQPKLDTIYKQVLENRNGRMMVE